MRPVLYHQQIAEGALYLLVQVVDEYIGQDWNVLDRTGISLQSWLPPGAGSGRGTGSLLAHSLLGARAFIPYCGPRGRRGLRQQVFIIVDVAVVANWAT